MGFHENAVFPAKIAAGSRFGPGFNTAIVEVRGGVETRTSYYEQPRHVGDISPGISTWDEMMEVKRFYIARLGAAYGFRFPDPLDYTSNDDGHTAETDTDQIIGDGDGTTVQFQLRKQYIDGGITRNRPIEKPVDGTAVISLDGSPFAASGNWSLDSTTGMITFTVAPGGGVIIRAGFQFHVPLRFDDDVDKSLLINFEEFQNGQLQPIGLIELVDERPTDDEAFRGGTKAIELTADASITPATGLLLQFVPDAGTHSVYLPSTQYLEGGGPYFYIQNNQATHSFDLLTDAGVLLQTVDPTEVYQLLISAPAGLKTWFALGPF